MENLLLTEVGAALSILGLLLVFFPIALQNIAEKGMPQKRRRLWIAFSWAIPALIALAAIDATLGLLTLRGCMAAADLTLWVLLLLVWSLVVVSFITLKLIR